VSGSADQEHPGCPPSADGEAFELGAHGCLGKQGSGDHWITTVFFGVSFLVVMAGLDESAASIAFHTSQRSWTSLWLANDQYTRDATRARERFSSAQTCRGSS
jgi:hypothetical protein